MQHHTAPGEVSGTLIAPFRSPPVKTDAAAQPRVLQCRCPPLPVRRNRRFLSRGDVSGGPAPRRIISVRIIDLDPMPAVIGAVSAVELAPMFAYDEIHPLRSLIVALRRLLPFALAQAD